jgi:hypothetical protein
MESRRYKYDIDLTITCVEGSTNVEMPADTSLKPTKAMTTASKKTA